MHTASILFHATPVPSAHKISELRDSVHAVRVRKNTNAVFVKVRVSVFMANRKTIAQSAVGNRCVFTNGKNKPAVSVVWVPTFAITGIARGVVFVHPTSFAHRTTDTLKHAKCVLQIPACSARVERIATIVENAIQRNIASMPKNADIAKYVRQVRHLQSHTKNRYVSDAS